MKKLFALFAVVALMGCAEKAPLTAEEQWKGYCKSIGNAARSILLDRQNGIEKTAAIEHADKVEDETTKKFVFEIIEYVYAMPETAFKEDMKAARDKIRAEYTEKCVATPFETMPDYKPL